MDYQTEVLNKLTGKPENSERDDRGSLLLIARHVPPSIVHAALAATQDARLRLYGEQHTFTGAARYFMDVLKRNCASAGIASPFTTKREQEAASSRASPAISQN